MTEPAPWLAFDSKAVQLSRVYLSDMSEIRPLEISNTTDVELTVQFSSTLGSQLALQWTNANVANGVYPPRHACNQLFNTIGHTTTFTLTPRQRHVLTVVFFPAAADSARRESTDYDGRPADPSPEPQARPSYDAASPIEVFGKLQFTARRVDNPTAEPYKHSLRFFAAVCRSVMYIDPVEADVAFDGCVVGNTFTRDFVIWNRSEIELAFFCATEGRLQGATLSFTNSETGEPVEEMVLPGFANVRVRMVFRPTAVGEVRGEAIVINLNNPANNCPIHLYARALAAVQEEALVFSAATIDFGLCYAGSNEPAIGRLSVRNITKQPLELDLRNGVPADVSFHIVTSRAPNAATAVLPDDKARPDESRCVELNLLPGVTHELEVRYTPQAATDRARHILTRATFLLVLKAFSDSGVLVERRTISCTARLCTSRVEVSSTTLFLGDLTVGTVHSGVFQVHNVSDIPTVVRLQVRSRMVSVAADTLSIPARQSADVHFSVRPSTVEPDFSKQIVVSNTKNPANSLTVLIKSNNIEVEGSALHALYYRITLPGNRPYLSFDDVPLNCPILRSFSIKNITNMPIVLDITPSRPEIALYARTRVGSNNGLLAAARKGDATAGPAQAPTPLRVVRHEMDFLDLATPFAPTQPRPPSTAAPAVGELHAGRIDSMPLSGPSVAPSRQVSVSVTSSPKRSENAGLAPKRDLMEILEELPDRFLNDDKLTYSFANRDEEEQFITKRIARSADLARVLSRNSMLWPIYQLHVPAQTRRTVYAVLRQPSPDGGRWDSRTTQKQKWDAKLILRLLRYDPALLPEGQALQSREVVVRAKVCQSVLSVGQLHIHLGALRKGEVRAKSLVIKNESEIALLYKIRTSGSVASSDINFVEGVVGVVRPYGWREVCFNFRPSMPGPFHEDLIVENLSDSTNNANIAFKANVRKPPTFELAPMSIHLGTLALDHASDVQAFSLTNTTSAPRTFVVQHDVQSASLRAAKVLLKLSSTGIGKTIFSPETLARLAELEQKMRIAERKKNAEKLAKYVKEKTALENAASDPADPRLAVEGTDEMVVTVPGKRIMAVSVAGVLMQAASAMGVNDGDIGQWRLVVYEKGNRDFIRSVQIFGTIKVSESDARPPALPAPANTGPAALVRPGQQGAPRLLAGPVELVHEDVELWHTLTGRFSLSNVAADQKPVHFSILRLRDAADVVDGVLRPPQASTAVPECVFSPQHGTLLPRADVSIHYALKPLSPGPQQYVIAIFDEILQRHTLVTLRLVVRHPAYIRFPEFPDNKPLLNFGNCHIRRGQKYVRTVPLRIENTSAVRLRMSCTSNLSQQVFIFADAGLLQPCDNIPLLPLQAMTVHVCLSPHVPEDVLASGQCREIEGGIQVRVWRQLTDAELAPASIASYTVRLTAVAGRSLLRLDKTRLRLGTSLVPDKEMSGTITVSNPSQRLPLAFDLLVPAQVRAPVARGILDPQQSQSIRISCKARTTGLTQYCLIVRGSDSAEPDMPLDAVLFLDPGTVALSNLPLVDGIPCIDFDLVYVASIDGNWVVTGSARPGADLPHRERKTLPIAVTNTSGAPMLLRPLSDLILRAVFEGTAPLPDAIVSPHPPPPDSMLLAMTSSPPAPTPLPTPLTTPLPGSTNSMTSSGASSVFLSSLPPLPSGLGTPTSSGGSTPLVAQPVPVSTAPIPDGKRVHVVGEAAAIADGGTLQLHVSCPLPRFGAGKGERLHGGHGVAHHGMLLLEAVASDTPETRAVTILATSTKVGVVEHTNVVKMLTVSVRYCMSMGRVASQGDIDLGRLGYLTSWQRKPFSFRIENVSEAPLYFSFAARPACVCEDLRADPPTGAGWAGVHVLPRGGATMFTAQFDPAPLAGHRPGHQSVVLEASNLYNPSNRMLIRLSFDLTVFPLVFRNLSGPGEILLSNLTYPVMTSPAETRFVAERAAQGEEVPRFGLAVVLEEGAAQAFSVAVLSRSGAAPIPDFSLAERETKDLRLRAGIAGSARVPLPQLLEGLQSPRPGVFRLGTLLVHGIGPGDAAAPLPTERLAIVAAIAESPMFALSTTKLRVLAPTVLDTLEEISSGDDEPPETGAPSSTFVVRNLSDQFPLEFSVEIVGSEGSTAADVASVVLSAARGTVVAGGGQDIAVSVAPDAVDLALTLRLLVRDACAVADAPQIVHLSIVPMRGRARRRTAVRSLPSRGDLREPEGRSTIELGGCARLSDHTYEVSLGQHDMGSGSVQWDMVLSHRSAEAVSYSFATSNDEWLTLSRSSGVIVPVAADGSSAVRITLSASTSVCGGLLTYLMLYNNNNPDDVKSIRVFLDVVVPQDLEKSLFTITMPGFQPDGADEIDFGDLFLGRPATSGGITIRNIWTLPLDFLLGCTMSDSIEVIYSRSPEVPAVPCSNLELLPGREAVIFIHIVVHRVDTPGGSEARRGSVSSADELPSPADRVALGALGECSVETYISCKVIRNHQRTIVSHGLCYRPAINVDSTLFKFQIDVARGQALPARTHVRISSSTAQSLDASLRYIREPSYFDFDVLPCQHRPEGARLNGQEAVALACGCAEHLLQVTARLSAILEVLQKQARLRSFMEHVAVYNQRRHSEFYRLSFMATLGQIAHGAPPRPMKHTLAALETRVVLLTRRFLQRAGGLVDGSGDDLLLAVRHTVDACKNVATATRATSAHRQLLRIVHMLFTAVLGHHVFTSRRPLALARGPASSPDCWPAPLAAWVAQLVSFLRVLSPGDNGVQALRDMAAAYVVLPKK
eukprot:m.220435 g.220435  ORF g.220435 m.220435 type:complete len:2751 (+) comp10380_c0_seq1:111-8363(+)